jgi:hypothetical protein
MWVKENGSDRNAVKLRNEELQNLYSSPNIIRVVNMKRMSWGSI